MCRLALRFEGVKVAWHYLPATQRALPRCPRAQDYTGAAVNSKTFLSVLQGEEVRGMSTSTLQLQSVA